MISFYDHHLFCVGIGLLACGMVFNYQVAKVNTRRHLRAPGISTIPSSMVTARSLQPILQGHDTATQDIEHLQGDPGPGLEIIRDHS